MEGRFLDNYYKTMWEGQGWTKFQGWTNFHRTVTLTITKKPDGMALRDSIPGDRMSFVRTKDLLLDREANRY